MVKYIVRVELYESVSYDGGCTTTNVLVSKYTKRFDSHSEAIDYAWEIDSHDRFAYIEVDEDNDPLDTKFWEHVYCSENLSDLF